MRVLLPLLLALLLAAAVTGGCGGGSDRSAARPVAAAGSSTEPSAAASGLPSATDQAKFFDAVASYDGGKLTAALALTVPGSPAADYLDYLAAYTRSATEGGRPVTGEPATPVDGGFRSCGGGGPPDECATWGDLRAEAGRLSDFTVNGQRLDKGLVDLSALVPMPDDKHFVLQPRFAYRSPQSGTLFVLVEVTAKAHDLFIDPTAAHYDLGPTTLTGVDDRGPTFIRAGQSRMIDLAFRDAALPLDGGVRFEITVPGHDVITNGFSLGLS